MNNHQTKLLAPTIPAWLITIQAICFAILYAVWMLPKVTFLRHSCLALGALLSMFSLFRYRYILLTKAAVPMYLIIALYAWLIFHLLFLSTDYQAQQLEFGSVWKNSAVGIIFGLGFGVGVASFVGQERGCSGRYKVGFNTSGVVWILFWAGLMTPGMIYIIKCILMLIGEKYAFHIPDYLRIWPSSAPFYISKNSYVCFCLPPFAIALGQFLQIIKDDRFALMPSLLYGFVILSSLFVFWGERIFNGFIYALLCVIFWCLCLLRMSFKRWESGKKIALLIISLSLVTGLFYQIANDSHFQTFAADSKVALEGSLYPQWKYDGMQGYPRNELGLQVNPSNYERISWFYQGVRLIPNYPLGYGLLQSSFGRLIKQDFPDSKLHQSHSGWLDLALGIGVVGIALILSALMWILFDCHKLTKIYGRFDQHRFRIMATDWMQLQSLVKWVLASLGLIWIASELSQKVYIDNLLFWISFSNGIIIGGYLNVDTASRLANITTHHP